MIERIVNIYELLWAMGYCYFVGPIWGWYKRHQRDADYFTHLGWMCGILLAIMMIFWVGVSQ